MATRQLSQKEADIQMMLAAHVHLCTENCDYFKRRPDRIDMINLAKTWHKPQMAARVIVPKTEEEDEVAAPSDNRASAIPDASPVADGDDGGCDAAAPPQIPAAVVATGAAPATGW